MKKISYVFVFITAFVLLFSTSCAPAQNPEETPATEIVNSTPNYSKLPDKIYPSTISECNNLWINKLGTAAYAGFKYEQELIPSNPESKTQNWRLYASTITINDRIVDLSTHHVAVCTMTNDGCQYSQELHPEEWLAAADQLAISAPDVYVTISYAWEQHPKDPKFYTWQVKEKTCTTEKPSPK